MSDVDVQGLRNLRDGYSLPYAVSFYRREHGVDLIEAYAELEARLAETLEALERLVSRRDVNETWEETIHARAALTTHHADGGAKPPPPDPRLVKRIEII